MLMVSKIRTIFRIALLLLGTQQTARAQSFVYPGIQPLTEGGMSQTTTVGTSSILWNPANIVLIPEARHENPKKKHKSLKGVEFYGDLSILSLQYTYTRSGYDPVPTNVTAPPITIGASWKPQSKFALGAIFVPRPATSSRVVPNVPISQSGEVILVNAEQFGATIISGYGIGFKPTGRFSLGLSMIETAEQGKTSATKVDAAEGEPPLLQSNFAGSFFQFVLGTRVKLNDDLVVAGSLKAPVEKKYSGESSIAGGTPEPTSKLDYAPLEIAIGFERVVGLGIVMGEFKRAGWSAGRTKFNDGQPGGAKAKDYRDTNSFMLGGRYQLTPERVINGAFGYFPGNVGYGSSLDPTTGTPNGENVAGGGLGDFDMLNRTVLSAGFKFVLKDAYVQTGLSIQNGSRDVPSGYAFEGSYKLSAYNLSVGGGKSF